MKFKVGDKVKIAVSSKYYLRETANNPACEGIVRGRSDTFSLPLEVIWDNGGYNTYDDCDLELVEETPTQVIFSPSQVTSAAEFLCLNNRYIDEPVEYFEDLIYSYIKRAVADDLHVIGAAGFYVMVHELVEGTVEVNVLVVPDVGSIKEYVEAELRNDKLVVEF